MSQQIWNTIIPESTSGIQLAQLLNDFKNAVVSGLSGTSRPSQLQAGGFWVDTTDNLGGFWDFKLYTGTVDIPLFRLNINTGSASISSTDTEFEIFKSSSDTVGGFLKFIKERASGGQVLIGDRLGDVEFRGTRDDSQDVAQARIAVVSNDDVTGSAQGAYFVFEVTNKGTSALTEKMRLIDGNLGVGLTTPTERIHAQGNIKSSRTSDTAATAASFIARKRRASGSGASEIGDSLSKFQTNSTDTASDEFEVANITVKATENHTATERGVEVEFNATPNGGATPTLYKRVGSALVEYFRNVTATLINSTITTSSIQTPSRLDVKQDTEANLITYATTATNGQLVYSTDTKSFFVITDGEIVPAGGGGGGSSLSWEKNSGLAPITEYVDGLKLESFDDESTQEIYALIPVPLSYRAGKPISLKNGQFATSATTGNVLFKTFTKVIKPGAVLGAFGNDHISTNTELTANAVANTITNLASLDLTSAIGEIDAVAVAPGDKLLVRLVRDNAGETSSAAADAKLFINSFELALS